MFECLSRMLENFSLDSTGRFFCMKSFVTIQPSPFYIYIHADVPFVNLCEDVMTDK